MQRGRWASQRTTKQYVEESEMEKALRGLSQGEGQSLAKWAAHFARLLVHGLAATRCSAPQNALVHVEIRSISWYHIGGSGSCRRAAAYK
jgi:hypothetical protein